MELFRWSNDCETENTENASLEESIGGIPFEKEARPAGLLKLWGAEGFFTVPGRGFRRCVYRKMEGSVFHPLPPRPAKALLPETGKGAWGTLPLPYSGVTRLW